MLVQVIAVSTPKGGMPGTILDIPDDEVEAYIEAGLVVPYVEAKPIVKEKPPVIPEAQTTSKPA